MELDIFSQGNEYISASRAAQKTGYTSDYIGQLARAGKIPAKLVERTWYVDFPALVKHKSTRQLGRGRRARMASLGEAPALNKIFHPSATPGFVKNQAICYEPDERPLLPVLSRPKPVEVETLNFVLARKAVALSLSAIILIGASTLVYRDSASSHVLSQSASASVFDSIAGSVEFFVSGFKNLKAIAVSQFKPAQIAVEPKFVPVEAPTVTAPVLRAAITETQPAYSSDTLKGDLKTELEAYIRTRLSDVAPVVYQSGPTYNTTVLREEILLADTRPTITRQSDSDSNRVSILLGGLTDGGSFTNASITNSSFSGTADFSILTFTNATGTSATTTNFFTTNASTTNLWTNIGSIGTLTLGNLLANSSSTLQNFSAQSGTLTNLLVNGSSTLQNFTAQNSTSTNATSSTFAITGNGSGLTFYGTGNHDITAQSGTLRIGSNTIIGNIEALDNTVDIGSVGTRFDKIYANEINATTLVGTIDGGNVNAEALTINFDNATADTEDSYVSFERGSAVPNALITWDSANDRFKLNSDLFIGSGIGSGSLLVNSSTTLQNFTFRNATGTNATTTNLAVTSLTTTRIPFASTGGTFIDSSALTFDLANGRLTTTYASTTQIGSTNNAYFATSGGAVGIGTTNPGSKLEITGATGSYSSGIGFVPTGTGARNYRTFIHTDGSFNLDDATAAATRLSISSTGNVGIGTTNPGARLTVKSAGATSQDLFHIEDSGVRMLEVISDASGNALLDVKDTTGTNKFRFNTAGDSYLNGGNVGIGTTNPGSILETIVGSSAVSVRNSTGVSSRTLYLRNDGTNSIIDSTAYGAGTGGDIVFQHNSATELARITSSGNVGIGTSNPRGKLEVVGTDALPATSGSASGNNIARFKVTGDPTTLDIGGVSSGAVWLQSRRNDDYGSNFKLSLNPNGGNVGVGTSSPYAKFSIQGLGTDINTPYLFAIASSTSAFATTTHMVVTNAGNIGIGTTNPDGKLHVDGTFVHFQNSSAALTTRLNSAASSNVQIQFEQGGTDRGYLTYYNTAGVLNLCRTGGSETCGLSINATDQVLMSGNVGIGTTNPGAPLHVVGGNPGIILSTSGATDDAFMYFRQTSTLRSAVGYSNTNSALTFYESGADRAVIKSGNLGIGTTNPETKLDVNGVITSANIGRFKGWTLSGEAGPAAEVGYSGGTAWFSGYNRTTSAYLPVRVLGSTVQIDGNSGTGLYLDASSNVGVGTTNPTAKLDVLGTASSTNVFIAGAANGGNVPAINGITVGAGDKNLTFLGDNTGTGTYGRVRSYNTVYNNVGAEIVFNKPAANLGDISFNTNDGSALTERLRILNTGNVGIGTTNPGAKLHVYGSEPAVRLQANTGTADGWDMGIDGTTNRWRLLNQTSGYGEVFSVLRTGNVGVGTTNPSRILDIQTASASSALTSTTGTNAVYSLFNNTGGDMYFGRERSTGGLLVGDSSAYAGVWAVNGAYSAQIATNGSTRMTILSSGNVGIGTTNPQTKLDVLGTSSSTLYYANAGTAAAPGYSFAADPNTGLINSGADQLGISIGGTTRMSFDSDSFYGVGTGAPRINTKSTATYDEATYGFVGDQDTGMYRGGANELRFSTANTDRLTINSSGNVGIGTTSPTSALSIAGATPSIRVTGSSQAGLVLSHNEATANTRLVQLLSKDGYFHIRQVADSEASTNEHLTLNLSNGNVGIGTTTPLGKLNVAGTDAQLVISQTDASANNKLWGVVGTAEALIFRAYNDALDSSAQIMRVERTSTAIDSIDLFTAGNSRLTINSSGNIGIGSTSPMTLLAVAGTSTLQDILPSGTMTNNLSIYSIGSSTSRWNSVWANTFNVGTSTWSLTAASTTGRFSIFDTANGAGAERLSITAAGNVGIGTTAPAGVLDVRKAGSSFTDQFLFSGFGSAGANRGIKFSVSDEGATSGLAKIQAFRVTDNTVMPLVLNPDGGSVGIGTTNPTAAFHTRSSNGNIASFVSTATNGSYASFYKDTSSVSFWGSELAIRGAGSAVNGIISGGHNGDGGNLVIYGNYNDANSGLSLSGSLFKPVVDNTISNGDGTHRWTAVYAVNGTIQTSDAREKHNILDTTLGLDFINKLRPVSYEYNDVSGVREGLIAQEVLTALEGRPFEGGLMYSSSTDRYGLNYAAFVTPLIKAVQEIAHITGSFKDNLVAWLGDAANGITEIIAGTFRAKDQLCINNTCVTETQLQQLLAQASGSSSSSDNSGTTTYSPVIIENNSSGSTTSTSTATSTSSTSDTTSTINSTSTSTPNTDTAPSSTTTEPAPEEGTTTTPPIDSTANSSPVENTEPAPKPTPEPQPAPTETTTTTEPAPSPEPAPAPTPAA